MSIKERDLGWREIQKRISNATSKEVAVGIMGGGEELEKAVANEFGTEKIPERPFMRQTFDRFFKELQKLKSEGMNRVVYDGTKPSVELSRVGAFYQNKVRTEISTKSGGFEPNADITIKRKGSETPLLDTGKMIQSIKVDVRNAK
jgi:hypothetical protein